MYQSHLAVSLFMKYLFSLWTLLLLLLHLYYYISIIIILSTIKVIRNKFYQCLRSMPRMSELIAWVICHRDIITPSTSSLSPSLNHLSSSPSSSLSHLFIDQVNSVLSNQATNISNHITTGDEYKLKKKSIHSALSLIIQVSNTY